MMITKERDEELKAMAEMRMKASEPHPYMRALVQKRIEGTITPLEDEALDRFYETEGMSGGFTPFFLNSEQEFERIRYHEARFANEALFKELMERKAGTIQKKTQLTDEEFFKLYGMTREEATAQDKFEDECFNDMFEQEEQERLADTAAILLADRIYKKAPTLPATEPTAKLDPKKEPEQPEIKTPEGKLSRKVYGNLEIRKEASKGSPAIIIDNSDPKGRDPKTGKRIQYRIPYGQAWENLRTLFFNCAFSEDKALPIKNPWRGLNGDYRKFIDEYVRHTSGRPLKWWIETK